MRRTVIVQSYQEFGVPTEFGRATLQADGSVGLEGFNDNYRRLWNEQGIYNPAGAAVPLTDGSHFLDLLLLEFRGGYMRAVEA